jgi:hypothetical protein
MWRATERSNCRLLTFTFTPQRATRILKIYVECER